MSVYPWIPGVPVCPYGRGFLVCPEAREETYLHIDVIFFYPTLRFFLHFNMDFFYVRTACNFSIS